MSLILQGMGLKQLLPTLGLGIPVSVPSPVPVAAPVTVGGFGLIPYLEQPEEVAVERGVWCLICGRYFENEQALEKHIALDHATKNKVDDIVKQIFTAHQKKQQAHPIVIERVIERPYFVRVPETKTVVVDNGKWLKNLIMVGIGSYLVYRFVIKPLLKKARRR